jgi:hypothetical protein
LQSQPRSPFVFLVTDAQAFSNAFPGSCRRGLQKPSHSMPGTCLELVPFERASEITAALRVMRPHCLPLAANRKHFFDAICTESGQRDSNARHPAWEATEGLPKTAQKPFDFKTLAHIRSNFGRSPKSKHDSGLRCEVRCAQLNHSHS